MKDPKERLHKVCVIGATPAGIAATNKLGEMGIPVTLIDRDADLNDKLASDKWRMPSGVSLNYALRPGLLRILRNPRIKCVLPAIVESIKHTPQGFSIRYKKTASYVDPEKCTLCGRCADICPAIGPDGRNAVSYGGRHALPGRTVIDKRRTPLCQANCPLGVNVQGYMALTRAGKFSDALQLIRKDNVLPAICGRICTHPCEAACRRNELDQPLAIKDVKRFIADTAQNDPEKEEIAPKRSEHVAVVGSGPAGLAAAADLVRLGYRVTVFEREKMPGGLLRYGIGPYRLPRTVLDQEIAYLRDLGVEFLLGTEFDFSRELSQIGGDFAAIVVAAGLWTDRGLNVPGDDLEGIEGCISFLAEVNRGNLTSVSGKYAVIGDGNSAFEAARTLVRLGAETTVISWFPEELIPADASEVEDALHEGVSVKTGFKVDAFLGNGKMLRAIRCLPTIPGAPDAKGIPWPVPVEGAEPVELDFDHVIIAIGQMGKRSAFGAGASVITTESGLIQTDDKLRTPIGKIFAAGDAACGPTTVVSAMASGRNAAFSVHHYITGETPARDFLSRPAERDFSPITPDVPSLPRARMSVRQPASRKGFAVEVALGLTEAQVQAEASRCLQCGACSECLQCVEVCAAPRAISHADETSEHVEHAGVIIIADPTAAPGIKGEDILRAYSSKTVKPDAATMTMRGFASAAEAMLLLGESTPRMKGHGVSFPPPRPPAFLRIETRPFRLPLQRFSWLETRTGPVRFGSAGHLRRICRSHPFRLHSRGFGLYPQNDSRKGSHASGARILRVLPARFHLQRLHRPEDQAQEPPFSRDRHQQGNG